MFHKSQLEPGEAPCDCPFHKGARFHGRMSSASPNQDWEVVTETYFAEYPGRPKNHYISLKTKNISHSYVVRCTSIHAPEEKGKRAVI